MEDSGMNAVQTVRGREHGAVSRKVMRDTSLPCEAKAIYSYLCSFAGDGTCAFPGVDTMIEELGMSRARFYKYRKSLVAAGYLEIAKGRRDGSKWEHNVYTLMDDLAHHGGTRTIFVEGRDGEGRGIGQSRNLTAENEQSRIVTVQNEESSQVGEQSHFGTVQNLAANIGWSDGSIFETQGKVPCATDTLQEGRDAERVASEAALEALLAMRKSAVNRNRTTSRADIEAMATVLAELEADGIPPAEVVEAWGAAQARCSREGLDRRYYPQLFRFLAEQARQGVAELRHLKAESTPTITATQAYAIAKARHSDDQRIAGRESVMAELSKRYQEALPEERERIMTQHARVRAELNDIVWGYVSKEMPGIEIPVRHRA